MKWIKIFLLICIISDQVGAQKKEWIELELNIIADGINLKSEQQQYFFLAYEQLGICINPFKSILNNSSIHFNIIHTHGDTPSEDVLHDLQVFSNIEAGQYTGLFEAYVESSVNGHSLLIGQNDLNAHFLFVDPALNFVNSSFGIMPTLSCNQRCSIFPLTSLGAVYTYEQDKYEMKIGLYDGNPGTFESNKNNLHPSYIKGDGIFAITELTKDIDTQNLAILKTGLYLHSSDVENYNDITSNFNCNYGAYFLMQYKLIQDKTYGSDVDCFIKGGISPEDRNIIPYFIGIGVVKHSLVNWIKNDKLGLAYAQAFISKQYRVINPEYKKSEAVVELFYGIDLLKYFALQPSVQYIINTGAQKESSHNLISLLRIQASF